MRPKFEVGEEVILQSTSSPKSNGECVVLESQFCHYKNVVTKQMETGYIYTLTIPTNGSDGWMESSLRKKHGPLKCLSMI